jgi:hypothetical protein
MDQVSLIPPRAGSRGRREFHSLRAAQLFAQSVRDQFPAEGYGTDVKVQWSDIDLMHVVYWSIHNAD